MFQGLRSMFSRLICLEHVCFTCRKKNTCFSNSVVLGFQNCMIFEVLLIFIGHLGGWNVNKITENEESVGIRE